MRTRAYLLQDLAANTARRDRSGSRSFAASAGEVLTARFAAALLFRCAQLVGRFSAPLAGAVKQLNQFLTGADIAYQAEIGPGLVLRHPVGVVVGMGVRAGSNLRLQQGVTLGGDGTDESAQANFPLLGHDVRVGPGACVLGGIKVGDRAQIGANSVVIRDVADDTFVAGVPAEVKRAR